jgi:hypothetical protein
MLVLKECLDSNAITGPDLTKWISLCLDLIFFSWTTIDIRLIYNIIIFTTGEDKHSTLSSRGGVKLPFETNFNGPVDIKHLQAGKVESCTLYNLILISMTKVAANKQLTLFQRG